MAIHSLSCHLLLLLLMSSLDGLIKPGSAFIHDWDQRASSVTLEPHITGCLSRDQETFRCWWSPGNFQNLSSSGALRFFYLKKESPNSQWKECPHYIYSNRECFFNMTYTSVWITYCMQLRGENNVTFYNENDCFSVEDIVRPDPPVNLNWTVLSISPSGVSFDVRVKWEPPPSADMATGWIRVHYELQYRERNTTKWEALEMQPQHQQTIFGLHIGKKYEVHIRCRMIGFKKFGEFSDSIFIEVSEVESTETTFSFTIVVVFGIVGILILVMLIIVSQQHRFMKILLPPVPAPKIKGINAEMLKKGKLEELNLILSGGGMGGLPPFAADFYQDEPWVEFIEVDAEDTDSGEKEDHQGLDTQRLLGLPQPINQPMNVGCANTISSFPDDDSGRASCYDPDLLDQDTPVLVTTLLPGQPENGEALLDVVGGTSTPERSERPLVQIQTTGPQTWVNTDFYAQVSNVMPSGGVVLSPGQQLRTQESTSSTEQEETQKREKDSEGEEKKEQQFELVVVDPEGHGNATESIAQQALTTPVSPIPGEGYQTIQPQQVETRQAAASEDNQSPYVGPEFPMAQFSVPVSDYTIVQEVDTQHSLLLHPPPHQSPPPCQPQPPPKSLSGMPVGYITPDLLGNLSP
uniref:Growth hormone receptor 1 n=1 Tax=Cynoglossus semilaevis TaxID=244447 RepID=B9VVQ1_CYNSE|nr:growth hormone receptor 1 [Cynoglossus semilaevis]